MPGGWMDGLGPEGDDLDDLDQVEAAPPPRSAPAPPALTCRHCGSDRISPRSSDTDATAIRFVCGLCNRHTTHQLPYGYRKVYRAISSEET